MIIGARHRPVVPARKTLCGPSPFLAALVLLLALPVLAYGAGDVFTDPQSHFAFDLPDGWQQDVTATSPGLIVQYTTANPDGAFSITAAPLPNPDYSQPSR